MEFVMYNVRLLVFWGSRTCRGAIITVAIDPGHRDPKKSKSPRSASLWCDRDSHIMPYCVWGREDYQQSRAYIPDSGSVVRCFHLHRHLLRTPTRRQWYVFEFREAGSLVFLPILFRCVVSSCYHWLYIYKLLEVP